MKTIMVPVESNDTMTSTLTTARLPARVFDGFIGGFALKPTLNPLLARYMDGGASLHVFAKVTAPVWMAH